MGGGSAMWVGVLLVLMALTEGAPSRPDACSPGEYPEKRNGATTWDCIQCRMGQYCPGPNKTFANNEEWLLQNLCPAGFYCPDSKVKKPCPAGSFCSNGTASRFPACQKGKGLYCPEGSTQPKLCPKGYFCETPSKSIICPSGYWCQEGVMEPRECAFLTICPEGSDSPSIGLLGLAVLVVVLIVRTVIYYIYFFTKKQEEAQVEDTLTLMSASENTPLSPDTNGTDFSQATSYKVPKPFYVTFKNMRVTLNNGLDILSGVNGVFQPGRMCAVMGPSGAGKSTLLTALLGTNTAKTSGDICINGVPCDLQDFKTEVAFVPQDDIVLTELTVSENLMYSAAWRLSPTTTNEERTAIVANIIKMLGVPHVKDTIVGDPENRGISGGQRKRVNIGCELVAHPGVLFLDEPTSGLDSTSSLDILTSLKTMAVESGMCIVAVIHQPRMSIFQKFDDVLLLAKGGRTVYMGETQGVIPYFNTIGYQVPAMENPADFLMDVIAGGVETVDGREKPNLVESWVQFESQGTVSKMIEEKLVTAKSIGTPERRTPPGFVAQGVVFLKRAFNQIIRRPKDLAIDLCLILLGSAGTGFVFGPNGTWGLKRLEAVCLFSSLVLGLLSCMAALSVFGPERLFFFREYVAGLKIVPYFGAKNIIMVYDIFLRSFIFCLIFYNFVQFYMTFFDFYMILTALTYSTSGLGYFISVAISPRNALLAAVTIPFVLGGMFSGFLPSIKDLKSSPFRVFVSYFSFGRWALQALVSCEYQAYPDAPKPTVKKFLEERGYDLDMAIVWYGVFVLIGQGVFFRLLSMLVMWADRVRLATRIRDTIISKYKGSKQN